MRSRRLLASSLGALVLITGACSFDYSEKVILVEYETTTLVALYFTTPYDAVVKITARDGRESVWSERVCVTADPGEVPIRMFDLYSRVIAEGLTPICGEY